jgi:hypothetical protein
MHVREELVALSDSSSISSDTNTMRIRRKPVGVISTSPWLTRVACAVVTLALIAINHVVQTHARARRSSSYTRGGGGSFQQQGAMETTAQSQHQSFAFNHNGLAQPAKNLIVVAGHSVVAQSGHLQDANLDERDWYLLSYQRHAGLPAAMVAHIQAGLRAASEDPTALLVFSGGQTRSAMGPESEGSSYYKVADAMNLWPTSMEGENESSSTVRARTTTEEYATDSFTNFLYSICRFYEITGTYPHTITVVSFTFKRRRFESMHARALQWPRHRLIYVGVDPPASSGFDLNKSTKGELENAALPFETDPYGCHSPVLKEKRQQRNPFMRTPPYELSCPDMAELLRYCETEIIDKKHVPWKFLG